MCGCFALRHLRHTVPLYLEQWPSYRTAALGTVEPTALPALHDPSIGVLLGRCELGGWRACMAELFLLHQPRLHIAVAVVSACSIYAVW
jgi:hypothetical protein